MLPFAKNDKRRWQCFVCGKEYTDFAEFKTHILSSHEEGREYVICPLTRCGAPVRDVKLHFKAKHPSETLPKTGQSKALIWKDHRTKQKLKTKRPAFREGYLVSMKNGGKEFFYRSGYECEVFECLEALPDVIAYDVEPFKDGISYLFKGEIKKYHPDILIKYANGRIEVWEVKPANQTSLDINEAKWHAANEYCKLRGWDFIVITEVGINKLKKAVRVLKETGG